MADSGISVDTTVAAATFLNQSAEFLWGAQDKSQITERLLRWKDWADEVIKDLQANGAIGDGGSVSVEYVKSGTGTVYLYFRTVAGTDTTNDKRICFTSAEFLTIEHYNGSAWGAALQIENMATVKMPTSNAKLSIGDTGGNADLRLQKNGASSGTVQFTTSASTSVATDKRIQHDSSERLSFENYNGATWDPLIRYGSGAVELPLPGAILRVGDGTGSPELTLGKSGAGDSEMLFALDGTVATTGAKRILHSSAEGLNFEHYNGSTWDSIARVDNDGAELNAKRLTNELGTALVAGDVALSGGWGTTATVSAITGNDGVCSITITSSGSGQAANPTATLTFTDGAWSVAPIGVATRGDTAGAAGDFRVTGTATTTATITFVGTPVASEVYVVHLHFFGGGST